MVTVTWTNCPEVTLIGVASAVPVSALKPLFVADAAGQAAGVVVASPVCIGVLGQLPAYVDTNPIVPVWFAVIDPDSTNELALEL
jgi:hypothetical protein